MENPESEKNFNPDLADSGIAKPLAGQTMQGGGMRIIQPVAGGTPPEAAVPSAPANVRPDTSSIYPDASRGFQADRNPRVPAPQQSAPQEVPTISNRDKIIIIIVRIYAALMILVALDSIASMTLTSLHLNFSANYGVPFINYVVAILDLFLGIGLFRLREIARQIVVFVSVLLLIFNMVELVRFLPVIKYVFSSRLLLSLVISLVLEFLPLIFLTRRSVKEVFS